MITSRPSPTLVSDSEKRFHQPKLVMRIEVTAHSSDVRAYVEGFLNTKDLFRSDQALCTDIKDTIVEAAQGL